MKKLFSLFLVLTMTLALFSGCKKEEPAAPAITEPPAAASESAPAAEPSQAEVPSSEAVTVKTIDEFLAALGSNKVITMEAGTYDLTTAADYGTESKNPAYTWLPSDDGYELKLTGLDNLILQGAGKESTTLVTTPRLVNVFAMENCHNCSIVGLTIGHTEGGEMCRGGVVRLDNCTNMQLVKLGLYGCGTIGVDVYGMENMIVEECEIYDCSFSGIRTYNLSGLTVENCQFHDLGSDDLEAYTVFMLENSQNVTIEGCSATDSIVMNLLDFDDAEVTVKNSTFNNNRAVQCGFHFSGSQPVLDGNNWDGNELRIWYDTQSQAAVDANGDVIPAEFFPELKTAVPTADTANRNQVHVSTVDEFLAAIASDTEIILDAELYDLSLAADYGKGETETYRWTEEFDGPELVISNVNNFAISSADGDVKAHTISATPRYADVLSFQHCDNVVLSGFTAGHTKEPGSCAGGVIYFDDCDNATVENCGLFGCGIIGIQADNCSGIHAIGCDIYECSIGGIQMRDVQDVTIDGCTFRDLGSEYGPGYELSFNNCQNVMVDGKSYDNGIY